MVWRQREPNAASLVLYQTIPASLHQNQVAITTNTTGTNSHNYSQTNLRNEATALSREGTNDKGIKVI
jgi:hypothetical protein